MRLQTQPQSLTPSAVSLLHVEVFKFSYYRTFCILRWWYIHWTTPV